MKAQSMQKIFAVLLLTVALVALQSSKMDDLQIGIQISPNVLNISSQGVWVTVHADIPYYSVLGATVTLNGVPVTTTFADDRGDLVAKFVIESVKAVVVTGNIELVLTGTTKEGETFTGTDIIKVIKPK